MSAAKIDKTHEASDADLTLCQVKCLILDGWPKSIKSIPVEARAYWNVRDIVVPLQLHDQMQHIIHESHLGVEKCKARARTVLYWPGMGSNIEQVVAKCSVHLKYQKSQHKEPMISYDIIDGRWKKIAMDIMTFHGQDFLVLVDYYSKYPEFTQLPDKSAKTIVAHTKSVCSRHRKKLSVIICLLAVANFVNLPETGASR